MSQPLNKLKTSPFSRRLSIAKTSLNIGKNWAKSSMNGLLMTKEEREIAKHTFNARTSGLFGR